MIHQNTLTHAHKLLGPVLKRKMKDNLLPENVDFQLSYVHIYCRNWI